MAFSSYFRLASLVLIFVQPHSLSSPNLYNCVDFDCKGNTSFNWFEFEFVNWLDFVCTEWISKGKTLINYAAGTKEHLSFSKNVDFLVLSKPVDEKRDDWVVQVCRYWIFFTLHVVWRLKIEILDFGRINIKNLVL